MQHGLRFNSVSTVSAKLVIYAEIVGSLVEFNVYGFIYIKTTGKEVNIL